MRQSAYFLKTSKTTSKDDVSVNARLLEQGGFVQKVMAGVYSYLPLGYLVLSKIETIVREEMNAVGGQEIFMPALHPKENWMRTKRWEGLDILFKVKSQHGYEIALGPTHEEIVTPMAQKVIFSYRDLPQAVFQIQSKFRDEPRVKSGLLRGREFRMKDMYSFHASEADFEKYYDIVAQAYHRIFKRLDLDPFYTEASGGTFSKFSHEFQVEISQGEDTIYVCNNCALAKNKEIYTEGVLCTKCGKSDYRETKASEVGNIFSLKTKFSDAFGLNFTDESGEVNPVIMGCYGLGPSRVMGVLVERFHDENGIMWPKSIAPFQIHLVSLSANKDKEVNRAAEKLYADLQESGVEVLYDDRDKSTGEKFADSDLIGIPLRLVISPKTLKDGKVELKVRSKTEAEYLGFERIAVLIAEMEL
jgi:prolyl-tRNA synthetase